MQVIPLDTDTFLECMDKLQEEYNKEIKKLNDEFDKESEEDYL